MNSYHIISNIEFYKTDSDHRYKNIRFTFL